ncbi:hypothetical protein PSQ40_04895 [Curvibacter sp. HBC61]|uniref:Uncharacterized protein n=1 Tax=Curvibacter cyanobacteriorum TaxID=3026422 RepID=A0ABT5MV28_9BURK|nr:hypothetical protein [Curvibacter sp. HBC61]MDD0837903.1 hypothetical protein [Curvibacter sp. HBC61]
MTTETTDPGILAIARVAHEATQAYARSAGDYATQQAWEALDAKDQKTAVARVCFFLDNPAAEPGSVHNALELQDSTQRAKAFIFHGVVRAIAREQART